MVHANGRCADQVKQLYIHRFKSKIGWIHLAETEEGIAIVDFPNEQSAHFDRMVEGRFKGYILLEGGKENKKAERQLRGYFEGKLKKFTLRLDLRGSEFQKRALNEVAKIPFGEVSTYGRVAAGIGNPKGARAVGMANARNPLPIIIPCHRVVATNGIGGYGGGIKMKKYLLQLEAAEK